VYVDLVERFAESLPHIEAILAEKEEGRPVTPEEYTALTSFVERVQREVEARRGARRLAYLEKLAQVRSQIEPTAYDTPLDLADLRSVFTTLKSRLSVARCSSSWANETRPGPRLRAEGGRGTARRPAVASVPAAGTRPGGRTLAREKPGRRSRVVALPIAEAVEVEAPRSLRGAGAAVGRRRRQLEKVSRHCRTDQCCDRRRCREEEESDESGGGKKKKGKKKKGARTVVFDEATGGMVVQKRRKPGRAGGWDEGEI
jgi:hypothetical protein